MGKMIGIDLGTTNSCVAVMEGGVPQVIPNQEGARTTPSIVGFTAKGERLVGQIAKRQALTNPKNTVYAVKRLIGRKFDEPEAAQARGLLPFLLAQSASGDVHIQIEDKVYSPPEISSFVLQKLKAAAEDYLGESVEEAIITVPAYFKDPQRQATKDAGLIAGLKVSRIINEPTAAALAYGLKNMGKNGQFVAVYDLGGGTFDITILEMSDGVFQVRATGGDTYLGGEDFDQRIIDWLIGEFQRETGLDLRQDRMALQRLKEAAEKAKCELSTAQQTEIVLPFISADASGPKHLNTVLTRPKYEELTEELLEKTIAPCRQCLEDASLKPEQIDEVLLVGGQTRAPRVTETVRRVFGKEPNRAVNPDEGVAMGAAIQTGIIQGEVKDLVLLDVTPHTLGIETKDGTFTPLIERNSTIPTRKSRVFTTVADNQTRVEVHVLQGESDMAAYNKSLAKFELTNIPPAPRGVPQIEVTFEIDVNGIVSVAAQDQATARIQSMVLHPSGGLSQAEVSRLVAETRAREAEEKTRKDQEAVVRQLEGLVANTMRSVQALEGKLTHDEQQRILDAIEKAKRARGDAHIDELRGRLMDMEKAAAIIGQATFPPENTTSCSAFPETRRSRRSSPHTGGSPSSTTPTSTRSKSRRRNSSRKRPRRTVCSGTRTSAGATTPTATPASAAAPGPASTPRSSPTSATSSATSSASATPSAGAGAGPGAARTCATTSRSPSRRPPSGRRRSSRSPAPRTAPPARAAGRRPGRSRPPAPPAAAPARWRSSRASSRSPAAAATAGAPAASCRTPARPAAARASCRSSATSS